MNGTCGVPSSFFTRCMVSMIIRATQKKMISKPVTSTSVEWKVLRNSVCCGQPRVEKVHRPELNQVSRTSLSWFRTTSAPRLCLARTSSSLRPT
ncbi:hypothetical protein D3C77_508220 [compost metagenome]